MTLRGRLIVAFLVLAVVPLTGIVAVSYVTSRAAFERAVESESRRQAERLRGRMAAIRADLDLRLGSVDVPTAEPAEAAPSGDQVVDALAARMCETTPLVEAVEFVPAPAVPTADGVRPKGAPEPPPHGDETVVLYLQPQEAAEARAAAAEARDAAAAAAAAAAAEVQELVRRGLATMDRRAAGARPMSERQALAVAEVEKRVQQRLEKVVLSAAEARRRQWASGRSDGAAVLGRRYEIPVRQGKRLLGHLRARIRGSQLLRAVLADARRDEGEVPFAVDSDGVLHVASDDDNEVLAALPLDGRESQGQRAGRDWVVVRSEDPVSKMSFGIARPLGDGLGEIRVATLRNLASGLALIGMAALGILPLSRRMTRDIADLTEATGRLAEGDLSARVPVRTRDEVGRLAATFNRMASDLDEHQRRLVEEVQLRSDQELRQRLLEAENRRKSAELEEARQFQLSLLPAALPDHPDVEIAVSMRTATEVGGDYYDFRTEDGVLTVVVGDATGHGASAGTMVTVLKSLFTVATDLRPASFLRRAAATVRGMGLGRMFMALAVVRVDGRRLVISSAAMPPVLVARARSGEVEEITLPAMPLGAFDSRFAEAAVELAPGDTVLIMSDGIAELLGPDGEPFGYERVRDAVAGLAGRPPDEVVAGLEAACARWKDGTPPDDDVTFVVLRSRP